MVSNMRIGGTRQARTLLVSASHIKGIQRRCVMKNTPRSICIQCNAEFKPVKKGQKYCSQACFTESRQPEKWPCEYCGKPFSRQKGRNGQKPRFCSKPCFDSYRTAQRPLCKHCGKVVPAQAQKVNFCSMKCRRDYHKPDPRPCSNCGNIFSPIRYFYENSNNGGHKNNRRTCSDKCRDEWKIKVARSNVNHRKNATGPDHHLWKGGTSVFWGRGPEWFRIAEKARDRDNRTCQHCGKSEFDNGRKLDVHHIVPYHDINNSRRANRLQNLISLCQSCHTTEDRKIQHQQIILPFAEIFRDKRRAKRA